jgi:O-antigen/teichoic acid export membrane protein
LTAGNVFGAALNLAQGILLARWLAPELYGIAALVMVYPRIVYSVLDAGSGAVAVKYFGQYHGVGDHARALAMCKLGYLVDTGGALVALGLVVLSAPFVAESVVHNPNVAGLIMIYGLSLVPRVLVGTSNALLMSLGRSPWIAAIETVGNSLRMVLVVGLVVAGWQVAGVVWANAAAAAVLGVLYVVSAWVLVRRACGASILRGRLSTLKNERRHLLSFFAYNHLNGLMVLIPQHLDTFLLGYFRGPTEVAYYRLAKNLAEAVEYIRTPLFSVSYAQLARISGAGQRQAMRDTIRRLAFSGLPLGLIVLAGAALVPVVLPLLVGGRYAPAAFAAQILIVAAAISLPFFWLRSFYLVKNLVREYFILSSVVTIAVMLFYPFVVWQWGFLGAALAMLVLQVIGTLTRALWLWRQSSKTTVHAK